MKYKVGQFVEVISNELSNHRFRIGAIVKVKELDEDGEIDTCEDKTDFWWVSQDEVKPTNKKKYFTPQTIQS